MPLTADPHELESSPKDLSDENALDAAATAVEGNANESSLPKGTLS